MMNKLKKFLIYHKPIDYKKEYELERLRSEQLSTDLSLLDTRRRKELAEKDIIISDKMDDILKLKEKLKKVRKNLREYKKHEK